METTVAIAVVSWNTRELLDACLASMRDDVERGFAEVWVVDNGSTDGSTEMVRDNLPDVVQQHLDALRPMIGQLVTVDVIANYEPVASVWGPLTVEPIHGDGQAVDGLFLYFGAAVIMLHADRPALETHEDGPDLRVQGSLAPGVGFDIRLHAEDRDEVLTDVDWRLAG